MWVHAIMLKYMQEYFKSLDCICNKYLLVLNKLCSAKEKLDINKVFLEFSLKYRE